MVNLPGGVKRNIKDINDDGRPKIAKNNFSFSSKINKDFNSKIACLPGNMVNTEPVNKTRNMSSKRNQTSDIFNRQGNNNNNNSDFNSFKTNNNVNRSIFHESKNEKKLIDHGRTLRPDFIRNPFISQISIK